MFEKPNQCLFDLHLHVTCYVLHFAYSALSFPCPRVASGPPVDKSPAALALPGTTGLGPGRRPQFAADYVSVPW